MLWRLRRSASVYGMCPPPFLFCDDFGLSRVGDTLHPTETSPTGNPLAAYTEKTADGGLLSVFILLPRLLLAPPLLLQPLSGLRGFPSIE
jgi:hypothetical protein